MDAQDFHLPDNLQSISVLDNGSGSLMMKISGLVPTDGSKEDDDIVDCLRGSAPASVIFESLIELLVSFYETDPSLQKPIFNLICQNLYKANVINSPSFTVPGLSPLRSQYQHAFTKLIVMTQKDFRNKSANFLAMNPSSKKFTKDGTFFFHHSRYISEFEELEYIAKGGFGSVYKVKNKLDNHEYAVKKIQLRYDKDLDLFSQINREVITLAKLYHPNIVAYKTAWIEPIDSDSSGDCFDETSQSSWTPTSTSESASGLSNLIKIEEPYDEDSVVVFTNNISSQSSSGGELISHDLDRFSCCIEEIDECDDEYVSTVVGMANTPPVVSNVRPANKLWLEKSRSSSNSKENKMSQQNDANLLLNSFKPKISPKEEKGFLKSRRKVGAMLYLQMQLCEKTLRTWIDERTEINYHENVSIFKQMLEGLAHIHSKGIIHRDLKPRNIFITSRPGSQSLLVQIGDFGLAKQDIHEHIIPPETPQNIKNDEKSLWIRRKHTSGVGTQAYAAPEQLENGVIDIKSDMYSMGIVMFELFSKISTGMERSCLITNLRKKRILPEKFIEEYPQIASVILRCTEPEISIRPTAPDLLNHEFSDDAEQKYKLIAENRVLTKIVDEQKVQIDLKDQVILEQTNEIEELRKIIKNYKL